MRLLMIAAAALLTTGVATGVAAPASAAGYAGYDYHHPGWHGHRRCQWVWRHHHRVRRCW